MRIYKYQVKHGITKLPKGSELLHIGVQDGEIHAWAMVPETAVDEYDAIYAFHTGEVCCEPVCFHKGTFLLRNGRYVLHVFFVPDGFSYT